MNVNDCRNTEVRKPWYAAYIVPKKKSLGDFTRLYPLFCRAAVINDYPKKMGKRFHKDHPDLLNEFNSFEDYYRLYWVHHINIRHYLLLCRLFTRGKFMKSLLGRKSADKRKAQMDLVEARYFDQLFMKDFERDCIDD